MRKQNEAKDINMKKIIFSVLMLASFASSAQIDGSGIYLGAGYNLSFANNKGLNYFIDRYNQTRPYLDVRMDQIHLLQGPDFSLDFVASFLLFDFHWTGRHANVYSQATDAGGVLNQRDLKVRGNTFDVDFGFRAVRLGPVHPFLGFGASFGSDKVFSRVYKVGEDEGKFEKINAEPRLGLNTFLDVRVYFGKKGPSLSLRPYYLVNFIEASYYDLNEKLNPNTYYIDDVEDLSGSLSHFGMKFLLMIPLYRK